MDLTKHPKLLGELKDIETLLNVSPQTVVAGCLRIKLGKKYKTKKK